MFHTIINTDRDQRQIQLSSDSTTMRKTRSVDFSRMTIRTHVRTAGYPTNHSTNMMNSTVASQFSRRAARGSFKT